MSAARDNEPPTPPLLRHSTLRPLSREHMGGLIQARNLQHAAESDGPARRLAVDDFVRAWQAEISDHFDDEERLLLPLTSDPALHARLVSEHRMLRELASVCQRDPVASANNPDMMQRLGSLLHDHIRWEERIYFEAIQREHAQALASMLHESDAIEQRRPRSRARRDLDSPWTSKPRRPDAERRMDP